MKRVTTMVYADTHKFVALVNKNLEIGRAMNAIAHSCAGLVASAPESLREKMSFLDFTDKDGTDGYGPRGKNYIAHVDIPENVRQAFDILKSGSGVNIRAANPLYASK